MKANGCRHCIVLDSSFEFDNRGCILKQKSLPGWGIVVHNTRISVAGICAHISTTTRESFENE